MALTFGEILNNACIVAGEEIPSSFSNNTSPYPELKKFIQDTLNEVCSNYPWTFREIEPYTFNCVVGTSEYSFPDYVEPAYIMQDGVRIENEDIPLIYIDHYRLDQDISPDNGKPDRYSIYAGKIIFDPPADDSYEITIKYLKSYYGFSSEGDSQPNLELENDYCIIPDRFLKVIEYGAAALYRGQFRPDEKLAFLQQGFARYLREMKKSDGYGRDARGSRVIGYSQKINLNQVGIAMNNYIPDRKVFY